MVIIPAAVLLLGGWLVFHICDLWKNGSGHEYDKLAKG